MTRVAYTHTHTRQRQRRQRHLLTQIEAVELNDTRYRLVNEPVGMGSEQAVRLEIQVLYHWQIFVN